MRQIEEAKRKSRFIETTGKSEQNADIELRKVRGKTAKDAIKAYEDDGL